MLFLISPIQTNKELDGKDEILLRKIRRGDVQAFEQFFRRYYDSMHSHAYKFVNNHHTAEEIVQEVFIHFWEKHSSIKIKSSAYGYLAKSVRNRCINYLKSNYSTKNELGDLPESQQPLINSTEDTLNVWELEQLLSQAIQQLPENCRIVFNLSRQAGLTYDEIALTLGVSKETVKSQIKIALKKLRLFLKDHWQLIPALF